MASQWPSLGSVSKLFGIEVYALSSSNPCSILDDLDLFFQHIRLNSSAKSQEFAEGLALVMIERNWKLEMLNLIPLCLAIPIREILRICQISPKMTYPLEMYTLIDRPDLFEFARGGFPAPEKLSMLPDDSVSIFLYSRKP